mgnify:CR=1 FL=1|jgi:3-oxoacyl-[acyl-carrier-protein] synthase-3
MSGEITDINYHLPKQKISIKDLCKKYKWPYEKIVSATGIRFKYTASKKDSAFNLAILACKKIKIKKDIDALIYVTQSPEYILPTTACLLQDKLKLKKNILAFDINQGCSGFVYALFTSFSFLKQKGINNVLIVCSDTYTKYVKKGDRSCETIFSDGASATIIKKNPNKKYSFNFGTDGSGSKNLIVKNSGANNNFKNKPELFMDGKSVFLFTMSNIPKFITNILNENKVKINEIKYFVFHQASKTVIDNLTRKLNLPKKKVYCNYEKFGNTVSSTIPIALFDLIKKKKIKKGDKILLCGFGVGYSVAGGIIEY